MRSLTSPAELDLPLGGASGKPPRGPGRDIVGAAAPQSPEPQRTAYDYIAIDLENMFGDRWSHIGDEELRRRTAELLALADPGTQILVVACPDLLERALPLLISPKIALRAIDGKVPDSADRLIQHHLRARAWRQGNMLIASGDGSFGETVRYLQMTGSTVAVIAVEGSCSRELSGLADHFTALEPCAPYATGPAAQPTACSIFGTAAQPYASRMQPVRRPLQPQQRPRLPQRPDASSRAATNSRVPYPRSGRRSKMTRSTTESEPRPPSS